MKKNIIKALLIFICVLTMVLNSCAISPQIGTSDHPKKRYDMDYCITEQYAYFTEPVSLEKTSWKRIVRMNHETGEISCPCIDPVCAHEDESCAMVLYGDYVDPILVFGNYLYFGANINKEDFGTEYIRTLYNMKTGVSKEIFKDVGPTGESGSTECVVNIGKYLYHIGYRVEKNKVTDKYEYSSVLQRYDMNSGKEEDIYMYRGLLNIKIADGERIYFGDVAGATYSVNKNGKYFRNEPNFTCDFPWYVYDGKAFYNDDNNVIRINDLKTGADYPIVEDETFGNFWMTDQYIYYLLKDSEIDIYGDKPRDENGRVDIEAYAARQAEYYSAMTYVWRCEHDGTNKQLVGELPGSAFKISSLYENYIYAPYSFYDSDTKEPIVSSNPLRTHCRINMDTWEVEELPHSTE